MSAQKRSDLQGLYGTSGTSLPDNTSGAITPADLRDEGQDLTDSHFNLIDEKYSGAGGVYPNITSTTGLKAIVTVGLTNGIIVLYRNSSGNLTAYQLTSGTDAESSPQILRPDDYSGGNQKVWKILSRSNERMSAPATTGTMTIPLDGVGVITITPTGDCTFNFSGGYPGQHVTMVVITSGTTSRTLTFGNYVSGAGTLATGTADSKVFTVSFVLTNVAELSETGRTTAVSYVAAP